ncbi:MAG: putative F420-dependent oxidoreductase [Candidatus Poriferisodalaceae bacterium]
MKFGLRYCNTGPYALDTSLAEDLVLAGEAAGFESAWTVEHTVVPSGYESQYPYSTDGKMAGGVEDLLMPDPLMWMAYMAGITSTINFATGILIVPQHNPVVAAKQIATLDYMSGGRVLLGIGVGWMREEFEAIGVPFDDRGRRTDEYVAAMRELWTADRPTFHGEFVNFDAAYCRPQPAQGSVPIIVGGDSKPAARRAGRLGDGYFPARNAPVELIDLARKTAEEHGRDPDALEITTSIPDDLADIPALAARGISRLVVPVSTTAGLAAAISGVDDVAKWADIIAQHADL